MDAESSPAHQVMCYRLDLAASERGDLILVDGEASSSLESPLLRRTRRPGREWLGRDAGSSRT